MKGSSGDIPVWKKDLVARLRAQNKCTGNQALTVRGRQLSPPYQSDSSSGRAPKHNSHQTSAGIRTCNQLSAASSGAVNDETTSSANKFVLTLRKSKMVQERVWSGDYNSWESDNNSGTSTDSDSSEDLHYGPGIVNKLKNKYLSLTLHPENRSNGKQRANLRKAASLEDILDEDDKAEPESRTNGTERHPPNRYRHPKRGDREMKRARSMEAISRFENLISPPPPPDNARPKSMHEYLLIADLEEGSDKCRKPKDSENETNGLFPTSYAPRVNRPKRIAPVMNEREKPPADVVKQAKMIFEKRPEERTKPPATTGEVAAKVATYKSIIVQTKQAKKPPPPVKTKPFLEKPKPPKVTPRIKATSRKNQSPPASPTERPKPAPLAALIPDVSLVDQDATGRLCHTPDLIMTITSEIVPEECPNLDIPSESELLPLKLIISSPSLEESPRISPVPSVKSPPIVLEKNLINAAKTLETSKVEADPFVSKKVRRPPRGPETNSIVFKFTDRKDVPDYVQNDRSRSVGRLEKPKVGEGGIILLPGAAIDESFTDEDEEIRKYLEAPPSPCDVTFINDNILIDGKSSIKQKTSRSRMRISFVESGPDVFEYPSESSLLVDGPPSSVPSSPPMTGHTVPNLSGSYLANYIPKATEEFRPGVTRSAPTLVASPTKQEQIEEKDELDEPVAFSAGTNSDMLF